MSQLLRRIIHRIAIVLEQLITLLGDLIERTLGREPRDVQIVPYRGYGTTQELTVLGRVLAGKPSYQASPTDRWHRNMIAMARRFRTREAAGVAIQVSYAGVSMQTVSDEEGYIRCKLTTASPLPAPATWRQVALELVDREPRTQARVRTVAEVLAPLAGGEFAVISDIDDTVLTSNATQLRAMLRLALFENAHTRLPFPGVAAFYRALQLGSRADTQNAIFYLSSSPWNLYDFLAEFMEINGLPTGPILLADYGLDAIKFIHPTHADHKEAHIRRLLDTYPALPFLLIGDSGQHDAEIYSTIVEDYPDRIGAVYIRNVSAEPRAEEIARLAAATQEYNVEMLLVADTLAAAEHAQSQGWITESSLDTVRAEVAAST